MQYFTCGKIYIPLAMVSGAAFGIRARTAEHRAGYRTARGLEAPEVSVRAVADAGICRAFGEPMGTLADPSPSCLDAPARLLFGSFEPFPGLLFALASINRTYSEAGIEADLVFAAVRLAAQELRGRMPDAQPEAGALPPVRLLAGGQALAIKGAYKIEALRLAEDGADVTISIMDDGAVPSLAGFLGALDGASVEIGGRRYASAMATLDGGVLTIAASLWARGAQGGVVKTYADTTAAAVLADLGRRAGMEIKCDCTARVSHYLARGRIMDEIRAFADSAGLMLLFRGGALCAVEAPKSIGDAVLLDGDEDGIGSEMEIPASCVWADGLHVEEASVGGGPAVHVASVYSGEGRASACLARERLLSRLGTVYGAWLPEVEPGSAVAVQAGDGVLKGIVVSMDADVVAGTCQYGVAYV